MYLFIEVWSFFALCHKQEMQLCTYEYDVSFSPTFMERIV